MQFGNLVNTRNSIINNFSRLDSKEVSFGNLNNRIYKGNDEDIIKGFEFIKTEKEMYNRIEDNIKILQQRIDQIMQVKQELVLTIGEEPTVERSNYGYDDDITERENEKYYIYDIKDEKVESKPLFVNNVLINNNDSVNEELKMKQRYNDLSWKCYSLKDRLKRFRFLLNNLNKSSSNKFKFSEYELKQYGF